MQNACKMRARNPTVENSCKHGDCSYPRDARAPSGMVDGDSVAASERPRVAEDALAMTGALLHKLAEGFTV